MTRVFICIVGLILWGLAQQAAPVWAAGGGYEGLIAPAAPDSPTPARAEDSHEPLGYSGVISGYTGDDDAAKEPAPSMTAPPELTRIIIPESAEELGLLAAAQQYGGEGIPDDVVKPFKASNRVANMLAKPRQRIENMLPMEYAVKKNVDKLMPGITDEKIPPEERAENVRKAQKKLATLAQGLLAKTTVPDSLYRQMGLSDVFISEEKESTDKALSRLNLALQELEKY